MFCTHCGKKIRDDAKFCPFCGAQTGETSADGAPADPVGVTPERTPAQSVSVMTEQKLWQEQLAASSGKEPILGKKKHRGIGTIVVLLVIAVVLLSVVGAALGLFGSTKVKVFRAAEKSTMAYISAAEKAGAPDLMSLMEGQKVSESMSVKLKELEDSGYGELSTLEGLGMRFNAAVNLPDQKMDMTGTVFYGSMDAATFQSNVDGDVVAVYSPEFLGKTAYGVNTMTLGKDLEDWGLDENVSFNLFDILNTYAEKPQIDKAEGKKLEKAVKVEKGEKTEIEVNDVDIECTNYHVVVPEDAMLDYLDALEDSIDAMDYDGKTIDVLKSIGVPEDEISYMKDDITEALSGSAMLDEVNEAVRYMGDLELDVYLKDGYVMAAVWEGKVEGTNTEISAYFGGGKNYADDLGLVMEADGETFVLESSGNHVIKNGTFTDTTTMWVDGCESEPILKSELEYTPKQSEDNFTWDFSCGEVDIGASGQLNSSKNSLALQMDKLSVGEYGSELCTLELSYAIGPYSKGEFQPEKTVMLSEMRKDDIDGLMMEIEDNAQNWVTNLMDDIPELQDLIWYLV
ncbi:hypothetical protein OBV_34350 [Oscillibacter valericigenes Sjm18-20]|nr:hypothetical protein OBV_34350 [Oscillibacter valericigenes Sjm18-20]